MLVFALLLSLVGCQCNPPGDVTELTEVGTACLDPDGQVRAGFGGCLSSSCDTVLRASCSASLEGTAVTIRGSAVVQHAGENCTKDCRAAVATCSGDPIADPAGLTVNAKKTPKLVRCWQ